MKLLLAVFIFAALGSSTQSQNQTNLVMPDGTVKMTGTHCFNREAGQWPNYILKEIPCPMEISLAIEDKERIAKLEAQVKCWKDWYAKFQEWEKAQAIFF